MTEKPIDTHLFELVAAAVEESVRLVQQLKHDKRYIGTYFDWHSISQFDSGLPSFHKSLMSGPTDYKDAFRGISGSPLIDVNELGTFDALLDYANSHDRLKSYFASPNRDLNVKLFRIEVFLVAEYLVDRYIHENGDEPFSTERLMPIYLPIERGLLAETLHVNIVVPILFLKFDFDKIALGAHATVERMTEDFQRARASKVAYGPGVHSSVLSAASHALILSGWELRNDNYWNVSNSYSETSAYPLNHIDRFFTALRIASGVDTGYAQLLMKPIDWAHDYTALLPTIEGTSIRSYPTWFENFYWLRSVPSLTGDDIAKISRVFSKLSEIRDNKLTIASQRLNRCFLRESEEDSILDAIIALEVLLSDDSRQEITHKLALRMAALSKLYESDDYVPAEVYRAIKKIYGYRSAIVHGSTKASRNREISLTGKPKVSAVTVAIDYLRMALAVLIENPDYLDPTKIDEEILLG